MEFEHGGAGPHRGEGRSPEAAARDGEFFLGEVVGVGLAAVRIFGDFVGVIQSPGGSGSVA